MIPSSAKVYIRLIHSEFLWAAHKLDPKKVGTADPSMCVCVLHRVNTLYSLSRPSFQSIFISPHPGQPVLATLPCGTYTLKRSKFLSR